MLKLLLFCILLVVCWPVALVALVLYPLIWLILLPFRLVGIVVGGTFDQKTILSVARALLDRGLAGAAIHEIAGRDRDAAHARRAHRALEDRPQPARRHRHECAVRAHAPRRRRRRHAALQVM